jgi:hypothetical protein
MKITDLIFTGFNRRVAALHRGTGQIVWQWKAPKGSSYVSLLLENDLLVVSVDGYMYGLDPISGGELWFNPMGASAPGLPPLFQSRESRPIPSTSPRRKRVRGRRLTHLRPTTWARDRTMEIPEGCDRIALFVAVFAWLCWNRFAYRSAVVGQPVISTTSRLR